MSSLPFEAAQRALTLLSGSIKGVAMYPAGHPAVRQPLQELHAILGARFVSTGEVRVGIHDGVLFVDDHLFVTPTTALDELAGRLAEKEIREICIVRGLREDDLTRLATHLAVRKSTLDEVNTALRNEGVTTILLTGTAEEPEAPGTTEPPDGRVVKETYNQAIEAVHGVFRDIASGRIPHSGAVMSVVNTMVEMTIQDPVTLIGLAMIKDYDNYTFTHSVNVGILAMSLGASMGLDRRTLEEIGIAGFLHDIGKTRIDKTILNKPGKLSFTEYEEMKKHPELGARIIGEMAEMSDEVAQAVLGHHIHHNRQGYPDWARQLPFGVMSEIIAVADCYDAITTLRVYQHPLNPKAALDELHELAGTYLDERLVNNFVMMMGKYPVGTLVRLDTNEIAVVMRPNPVNNDAPVVKIIMDMGGVLLPSPRIEALANTAGACYARIVAVVNPLLKNIDVGKYLN
jgi:putative nucleotidyltransferase with HDIG domain